MPKQKPKLIEEKSQRERFIETARAVDASEDPAEFDRVFEKVVISHGRPRASKVDLKNGQ